MLGVPIGFPPRELFARFLLLDHDFHIDNHRLYLLFKTDILIPIFYEIVTIDYYLPFLLFLGALEYTDKAPNLFAFPIRDSTPALALEMCSFLKTLYLAFPITDSSKVDKG